MVRLNLLVALLSLGGAEAASEMLLPRETVGMMVDMVGMSPRPTDPPGVRRDIPKELVKRASRTAIDFPAPGFYCGLVNGDISCCISSNIQQCTDIATKCLNWEDKCDENCKKDSRTMYCAETTRPFCATYFFGSGSRLYGCRPSTAQSSQVVPMSEYFSSRYGPNYHTMASSSSIPSLSISEGTATETPTTPPNPQQSGGESGGENEPDSNGSSKVGKKKGLGGGAIGGIVAGAAVAVIALIGFIVLYFLRKKKAAANASQGPPPSAPLMPPQHPYGSPPVGAGYFAPDQKPAAAEVPPYISGYPPHVQHPPPVAPPSEMAASPVIQNPQSQPLLSASDYYNQNRPVSYMQPGSPQPSTVSPPPGGVSVSSQPGSPQPVGATHTGPVSENIYEMPGNAAR
ncbi:hypothetical protein AJ79_09913 [Helicocarpus griseus UAMH5409]|uniref:Mid2 domain-containing protein n=1 Tax=Helicocarpus griseus UAMH5409 TaxID=1447875 RepID=A0A2B7WG47_9EURO|nr:hypothetical protein AJ79_09913 [Helicocarpus griseus UAMH5409]